MQLPWQPIKLKGLDKEVFLIKDHSVKNVQNSFNE